MDLVLRQSIIVVILGMAVPLTIICAMSVLAAIVQSVTQIQEQSISFTVKLFTLIVILYIGLPLIERHLTLLNSRAMQALINVH